MGLMATEPRPRGFISHAATYAVGNIARKLVGFAMLPIYTRFLTPADYGVIGLLTFALAVFEPIFGARLGRAIPKFYFEAADAYGRRTVVWGAIGVTSVVSAVTMTVLILFRGVGSELLFGDHKYALALGLFAVNLLTLPIEDTGLMYVRLRERSRLFLGFSMIKLLIQVALNLLLVVYWNEGVVGVVLSGIISSIAIGTVLVAYVAIHERPAFEWKIARVMMKFCWPLWLGGLAGLYVGSSGAMYLRVFDTLSDVGRLELAIKFATVMSALIWGPFFQHWEPLSYRYYKEADAKRKFQVAFVGMSTLMFAGGLGISIFAQPVIRIMAERSFYPAATIVPFLTLAFILNSLRSFFNFSFLVTGHTKVQSFCVYVTAIIITVAYVVLIPNFGLMGAAVAFCVAFSASFLYIRFVSRRYYDPGYNIVPIGVFILIGSVAYMFSNVLLQMRSLGVDLLIKSFVFLCASSLMLLVGIRAIRATHASAFDSLPWPLDKLGRLSLGRSRSAGVASEHL